VKINLHIELLGDVDYSRYHVESPAFAELWNRHQDKLVTEGVAFIDHAIPDKLTDSLMGHIDELKTKGPVDYHPHSNNVVRDHVHPALYVSLSVSLSLSIYMCIFRSLCLSNSQYR